MIKIQISQNAIKEFALELYDSIPPGVKIDGVEHGDLIKGFKESLVKSFKNVLGFEVII